MVRQALLTCALLLAFTTCTGRRQIDGSEHRGATAAREVPVTVDQETESAQGLFRDIGRCGNRYRCPPWDELQRRAERGDPEVLRLAFEIMQKPQARGDLGEGKAAANVAGWWIDAASERGILDEEKKRFVRERALAVMRSGSKAFRRSALAILSHGALRGPEVERILREVCELPTYDEELVEPAAQALAEEQKDMALARAWLESPEARLWRAGVALVARLDMVRLHARDEERELLMMTARRKSLPADVALEVIRLAEIYQSQAYAPALEALAGHPDREVRGRAQKVLEAVRPR